MNTEIVIFTATYNSLNYGIGTYLVNLEKALSESRFSYTLVEISTFNKEIGTEKRNSGSKIIIPYLTKNVDMSFHDTYLRNVAFLLKTWYFKEDCRYIFHLNLWNFEGLADWLKKLFKCRIVLTVHYTQWSFDLLGDYVRLENICKKKADKRSSFENIVYAQIEKDRRLAALCDWMLCSSRLSAKYPVEILSFAPSKIVTFPHGIEDSGILKPEEKQNLRTEFCISPHETVIVFAGRFDKIKGLAYLIEAIKKVLLMRTNVRLFIVGNGRNFEQILKTTFPFHSKISFTGFISSEKLYQLYSIADIGVICSIFEEFGYVAVEMLMHGLPVITTAVGGLDEIFCNNVNSAKVPVSLINGERGIDVDILAARIIYMIDNQAERLTMGRNARASFLERYSFQKFRDNVLNFYESVVK
jgi:glycosyltransferase